jgi:hypothetical protein
MSSTLHDIRYGLRTLGRTPGFTAIAVLTIGIGIGASTTVFSWMRAMLLNPIPGAKQPERIVAIENLAANRRPAYDILSGFPRFSEQCASARVR